MMRSADVLVRTLDALENKYIFSLSGNQIMPVYDAWIDSKIELIHVRHEAAAVHMADAWGRLTGRPGVALLTAGPGHANAISAMYVALMAESPLVVISGHAPLTGLGHGAFQEMAQVEMAAPVTKASWLVREAEQVGYEIDRAFRLSRSGRPGPVHLSIPNDVLEAEVDDVDVPSPEAHGSDHGPRLELAGEIMAAIGSAERPLVLAGPATMRSEAFRKAESTFRDIGLPLIGMESPRGVYDPALGAFPEVLAQADLLILLGKKLDFSLGGGKGPFKNPQARLVQIDADDSVLALSKRNINDDSQILNLECADVEETLNILVEELGKGASKSPRWYDEVTQALSDRPTEWNDIRSHESEALHPLEVGRAIDDFLSGASEGIFISDGGEFGQWMQACVDAPQRIINGPAGAIGSAIPFALAARLAFPSARIVTCTGDGAFGFHPFEIDTAVRYKIPFITVIGNDACWNAEYQIQLRDYGKERAKGCDLLPSAYHEVGRALGAWGQKVERLVDLPAALVAAQESGLPAVLNVSIRRERAPKV